MFKKDYDEMDSNFEKSMPIGNRLTLEVNISSSRKWKLLLIFYKDAFLASSLKN